MYEGGNFSKPHGDRGRMCFFFFFHYNKAMNLLPAIMASLINRTLFSFGRRDVRHVTHVTTFKSLEQSPILSPDRVCPVSQGTESSEEVTESGCGHMGGTRR